jgi:serine/threonine protein kinase
MMPELDGIGFIRRVRAQIPPSSLPMIVVSSLSTEQKVVEAFDAGATDYLIKPFRSLELLARIRVALKQCLEPAYVDSIDREPEASPAPTELRNGAILDMGKYTILSEIGGGGMGTVYHARHRSYGTEAAVKVLNPERTGDRQNVIRFLREVRIAARMDHPNIVRVFDFGLTKNLYYYAMEKLPERSLAAKVLEEGPLPEEEVLNIGLQLSSALKYMHDLGFIHRDVKPDNVLFAGKDRVCLIDFGVARAIEGGRHTQEGSFVGTPGYVAPETIASDAVPSPAGDIYALGATLYAAAAGRESFCDAGGSDKAIREQLHEVPTPPRLCRVDLSEECSALIMKMLSREPAGRPAHMGDVYAELQRIREALPGS